jgi:hypothetical protein
MGTTTRRLAVALAAAGLLVSVGCAKDETVTASSTTTPVTASSGGGAGTTEPTGDEDKDSGSGEYAEACAAIEEIDQLESDGDLEEGLALFEDARDAGPEELADHWDKLSEVYEELVALDQNDEEAMATVLALMDDPEFLEAAATIDDFAEEECGLDIDLDPAEESDTGGGLTDDTIVTETTDPDADPTSIDALQAHLEATYGTEAWWPILDDATTWGSSGGTDGVEWSVTLSSSTDVATLSASDLEAACDAMADYLDTYEDGDVTIEIVDTDDTVLVSREAGEACAAA